MGKAAEINNDIYNTLNDRWYTAYDDPVALLRAETQLTGPWIQEKISELFKDKTTCKILDIGCGGGFLSNRLSLHGHSVTGIDLSEESLAVAKRHDSTGGVRYVAADAYHLPFEDGAFDVVTAMDFLEHVENPQNVIREVSRVLAPGGVFFFHTFNRNPISGLVIIKFVEWFVKNTPKHMHLLRMFITPKEMKKYCAFSGLEVQHFVGTRPQLFNHRAVQGLVQGKVPQDFKFSFTKSLLLAYMGYARKICPIKEC
jgi:2-polyprenyl-6-hydroxyphenyl methylase/3-demethylubiquinone-9 3-methyltransferase